MKVESVGGGAAFGKWHTYTSGGMRITMPLMSFTVNIRFSSQEWERWYSVSKTEKGTAAQEEFRRLMHQKSLPLNTYGGGSFSFRLAASSTYPTPESAAQYALKAAQEALKQSGL